jgi:hypothetical protein
MRFASLCVVLASIVIVACGGSQPTPSTVKFDSAHSVALDAVVPSGKLRTRYNDVGAIKAEIEEQLMYTTGQLNGIGGVGDMQTLEISVGEIVALDDEWFSADYAAKFLVSWPREVSFPETMEVILPAGGDYELLQNFFEAYGADEDQGKRCLAWEAHDVSQWIFWYYYRPAKSNCPLRNAALDAQGVVQRSNMSLAFSAQNTTGRAPEYEKVWEDGRLVVTAIFGKAEDGATSNSDAGIAAYRQTYSTLIGTFGQPTSTTLPIGQQPNINNPSVRMTFNTVAGELDVQLYMVEGIRMVDQAFRDNYNARTKISDFVSYSGHSGLGANIQALAGMGQFVQGQYQIFLVNGCDTFAYVDNSLRDAHAAVNPGEGVNKYFDIITNAMPSYFHMNATSNMAVINALIGKALTYRELLAGFDINQRAAVTGEQDNRWPLPFAE